MIWLLLPTASTHRLQAQQHHEFGLPYFKRYTPQQMQAQTQNWDMVQDDRGLLYIGNNSGVLEFDGAVWTAIPLENRLIARSLAIDDTGTIYYGGLGEIGYLAPSPEGELQCVSLVDRVPEADRSFQMVHKTLAASDGVYFQSREAIFRWDGQRMRVWKPSKAYSLAFLVDDTLYAQETGRGLMRLEGQEWVNAVEQRSLHDWIQGNVIMAMAPLPGDVLGQSDHGILIGMSRAGLFLFDGRDLKAFPTDADAQIKDGVLVDLALLPDGQIAIATLEEGLFIVDRDGKLQWRHKEPAGLSRMTFLFVDRQGELWTGLANGLVHLELPGPLSVFGEALGLRGSVHSIVRHEDALYAGTLAGLFRLQPAGPSTPQARFETLPNVGRTTSMVSHAAGLLAATDNGLLLVGKDRTVKVAPGRLWAVHASLSDDNVVFYGGEGVLGRVRLDERGSWEEPAQLREITGGVRDFVETQPGTLWVSLNGPTRLARLRYGTSFESAPNIEYFAEEAGLPGGVLIIQGFEDRLLVSSSEGFLRWKEEERRFIPEAALGEQYAGGSIGTGPLEVDSAGNAWFALPVVEFARRQSDGSYQTEWTALQRMPPFLVNAVYAEATAQGQVVWVGGSEGIVRYEESKARQRTPVQSLLRWVEAGGGVLFGGVHSGDGQWPRLPFERNHLFFEYASPSFNDTDRTRYQYWLEGFDSNWSDWTDKVEKEYTNLPAEDYTFRVRARDALGILSEEGVYRFAVLPPWYQTWWAYAIYGLTGLLVVFGVARVRTRQLEARNRRLEETVRRRTEKIRRQAAEIELKNEENERLLLNILPASIAERLKRGEEPIVDAFPEVTVLFADLVGFTKLTTRVPSDQLMVMLNQLFSEFDRLAAQLGVEKIKTIGDAYMAVAGLPEPIEKHARAGAELALGVLKAVERFNHDARFNLQIRIGLNSGPVVAGVIGTHKFIYDLWGDTVNIAARMESHGIPGQIHVTAETHQRLKNHYTFQARGAIEVKGKGKMQTYLLASCE